MLIEERHGLLKFVSPNFLPVNVLLIDSPELLAELRKILPAARIAFMTTKRTPLLEKLCNEFRADLLVGNSLSDVACVESFADGFGRVADEIHGA